MILNNDVLVSGAKKALANSEELIKEANFLLANNCFARAFTLFQLSIEETGKAIILYTEILFPTYTDALGKKKLMKRIRNHKIKTKAAQRMDYILAMVVEDQELKLELINNVESQRTQLDKINNLKNQSLYTSIVGNSFVNPTQAIGKELAKDFKFYAEVRVASTKQFYSVLEDNMDKIAEFANSLSIEDIVDNPPQEIRDVIALRKKVNEGKKT